MNLIITGITGTLGKALLEEQELLLQNGITKIRGISRDEQKQVSLQREYKGRIQLDCYLGDVMDGERMRFALKDSHFLIHAAAQKHIDKFELDVEQGYRTNIDGTKNVAKAFLESFPARKAVFVSTDKSVEPVSSYGVSKLAAEHLWLWFNTFQKKTHYSLARWGNVFGSRGSVIETWTSLARKGESLPITDLQCTRFLITKQDAARFLIDKLFHGRERLHIPPMKSTPMVKLAEVIWKRWQPEKTLLCHVTGMRSDEKIDEVLERGGPSSQKAEWFTEEELLSLYEGWLKDHV